MPDSLSARLSAGVLAACILAAVVPGQAQACRVNLPIEARIANGYKQKGYDAVLIVRVTETTQKPLMCEQPGGWRAKGAVERRVSGGFFTGVVTFGRTGCPTACEDGAAEPGVGDLWAVYAAKLQDGRLRSVQSYPINEALRADPRLAVSVQPLAGAARTPDPTQ